MHISTKDTWVFDLDNTLYNGSVVFFKQIEQRMQVFIAETLKMDLTSAHKVQKEYLETFGTSLMGLMKNHDVKPDVFLDFVHDVDYSSLQKCEKLSVAIKSLRGRKFIFTNGTKKHANTVLARLDLESEFDAIFDIVAGGYIPKPNAEPYERFISTFDITPETSIFIEDMPKNLQVPKAMGFYTVLVEMGNPYQGHVDFIDYRCDTVADFIHSVTGAK